MSSHRSTETAITYLCGRALSKGGIERLAVIFSVPAAFFRWGLVSFAAAILWLSLYGTSGATRIAVCVAASISVLLLIAIVCNGEWKMQLSSSSLTMGVKRMGASAIVATRLKVFPKPKTSILPK
ncbi:hypothetical protein V8D89_012322 [Ganoderma adspersum]